MPLIANMVTLIFLYGLGALCVVVAVLRSVQFWRNTLRTQKGLIDRINRILPQTQCGQCGYEGCLPYARAIASGTPTNQCPPGGAQTILQLTNLLNEFPQALNPAHGKIEPLKLAVIREEECIGCTKCIKACPVDAILGGAKLMHTVIASECTGCDLCVEPCPVDCIDMIEQPQRSSHYWQLPSEVYSAQYPLHVTSQAKSS